jgi:hypothetical protein
MPIHDLGYRQWNGKLTSEGSRWAVIAETGLRRVWQSAWIRRIIFFAWLPLLIFGLLLLFYELAARGFGAFQALTLGILTLVGEPELLSFSQQDLNSPTDAAKLLQDMRHPAWLQLVRFYLRIPQGLAMILLVGLISPRLISEDISSRAFLFYFSRPLKRYEYVLGKSVTVWGYLAAITMVPAGLLYLMAVAFSASPEVLLATWDIPFRIVAASLAVIIPAGAISLCFSSLTRDSRYAGFAWFALWTVGIVSWVFVSFWRTSYNESFFNPGSKPRAEEYLSLHHAFGGVQSAILGMTPPKDAIGFAALLVVATVVSIAILFRRVSSPMRA